MSQVMTKPAKQTRKRTQVATAIALAAPAPQGNPDGSPIRTSMGTIADEARTQVTKSETPTVGLDARMLANNLANRVIAQCRQENKGTWRRYACEVIALSTDGRVQFLKSIREWLAEARKSERETTTHMDKEGKPEPTKEETKAAGARVNSATVEVSKLTTIATAFNGQATQEGCIVHYQEATGKRVMGIDEVPLERIVEYAKTFGKSAAGRKPAPWLLRMVKVLEQTKPRVKSDDDQTAPDDDSDVTLHATLVQMIADAVKARPAIAAEVKEARGLN